MTRLSFIVFFVFFHAVFAAESEQGRIWSMADQAYISEQAFYQRIMQADILWLGETHDNLEHHAIQAEVIDRLAKEKAVASVMFEMMNSDQQTKLDKLKPASADEVFSETQWAERGWRVEDYLVVVDAVVKNKLPMIAGNISRLQATMAWQEGPDAVLGDAALTRYLGHEDDPAVSGWLVARMLEAHCTSEVDGRIATGMLRAQRTRDAHMAQRIAESPKPVIAVVGRIHARYDVGAPRFLSGYRQISIGLMPIDKDLSRIDEYLDKALDTQPPFDYVWFTEADAPREPCPK